MRPRWISVSESLPTHIHSVLLVVVDDGLGQGDEPYVEIGIYNDRRGKWQVNFGNNDIDVGVSHWMPLPELPHKASAREVIERARLGI